MIIVETHQLAEVWPKVEHWISDAIGINPGDETVMDVLIAVARGTYVLWWEPGKFAGIVQIMNHARRRAATIIYIGGELDSILNVYDTFKRWCRQNNIDVVRVWGRRGWERVLPMKRIGVILQEVL